ncbi:hypothetical protein JCM5350_005764 [Sporobolomyces pararoseus]
MSGETSSSGSSAFYMAPTRRPANTSQTQGATSGHLTVPGSGSRPGSSQVGTPATYRSEGGLSDTSSLNPQERAQLAARGLVPNPHVVGGVGFNPHDVNSRLAALAENRNGSNSTSGAPNLEDGPLHFFYHL